MALKMGIVGLPNVGKSTTFNALTKAQHAEAANYPFCTIEPNRAIVPVPDERLDKLAGLANPERVIAATIEFVDIAGLVAGASKGEGLGNKFLANIRETAAIVHVVRCFDDPNVIHVHGGCDPKRDIEVIDAELMLADLEQIDRRIDRLSKQAKGDKKIQPMLDLANALKAQVEAGKPIRAFPGQDSEEFIETVRDLQPISAKKVIFAANVDESALAKDNDYVKAVRAIADEQGAEVVKLCAKVEEEMAGLSDAERQEFLDSLGAQESGLDQVIRKSYQALGLISYFTAGPKEVRAWTVRRGAKAPEAAGVIHTDFERGFIRAEVIHYDDYVRDGGESGAKAAGHMTSEGKDYLMQDGDVVLFRFNV
jgi:GTP-binding protein YchF